MEQTRLAAALQDRYIVERELGQGGMATVFLAQDVRHDRKVRPQSAPPRPRAYVQPLTGGGPAVQVSTEGGVAPRWSPDDRTLYYIVGETIGAATRSPGPAFVVVSRKTALEGVSLSLSGSYVNWDLHPNGKEFLYIDSATEGGLGLAWILDWPGLVRTLSAVR